MSEKELIIALKNGSEAAFNEIYELHWNRIHRFTSLYIIEKEEIREIVQDVFIKLWESRSSLNEDEHFAGYLFIITRNHIFNKSRKSFNDSFYRETLINASLHSYDIEDEIVAEDMKKHIELLINNMPPQRQKVFNLSRNEYKTYKEIASLLNISEKTVERHINEAIKYLKSSIKLFSLFLLI